MHTDFFCNHACFFYTINNKTYFFVYLCRKWSLILVIKEIFPLKARYQFNNFVTSTFWNTMTVGHSLLFLTLCIDCKG